MRIYAVSWRAYHFIEQWDNNKYPSRVKCKALKNISIRLTVKQSVIKSYSVGYSLGTIERGNYLITQKYLE